MSKEKEKNLWPISITIVILVVIGLIIYTVRLSTSLKVQDENAYMSDYQSVDANINDLLKSKKEFIMLYAPIFRTEALQIGENEVFLDVSDNAPIEDVNLSFFLTRPHTNVNNQDLGEAIKIDDTSFKSKKFTVEKEGRWRIIVKAVTDINGTPAVLSYDLNATTR